eukprot:CCRYP_000553-RA/>CCRYP_000553-RA protein AED:0.33 eAED:0.33 QI:0/0/0/1/0/0/2/0/128
MLKAMYRLIRRALLFYLKLAKDLPDFCFKLNPYDPCLANKILRDFHHSVAQLPFVSTQVRQDIQTAVAFLTIPVKRPDKDDWGKLKRVLKYLNGTQHMRLRLGVEDLRIIQWWVDASYNVHEDCRGAM